MNPVTYRRRKAQHLCVVCGAPAAPGLMRCDPCRDLNRAACAARRFTALSPAARSAALSRARLAERPPPPLVPIGDRAPGAQPGPVLWHCGVWHPLTTLPFVCPTCGIRLLGEVSHGVD